MTAGYTQFFGTKDQPNKPARTTLQVVLPAGTRGALVEIDLIAVRPKEWPNYLDLYSLVRGSTLTVGRN
jgi:hypothetical protein